MINGQPEALYHSILSLIIIVVLGELLLFRKAKMKTMMVIVLMEKCLTILV